MNLIMCFDGTWNDVKDHTNVSRLYAAICASNSDSDEPQLKYYDEGVGTDLGSRLTGGAFGVGLTKNIRQGYEWLMQHYQPNAKLFLFGFSRGAYTARSLAGMIGRCGILDPDANHSSWGCTKNDIKEIVHDITQLYKEGNVDGRDIKPLLSNATRSAEIHFMGVWDTVGALGVPFKFLKVADAFHDTELGPHVRNAFHAVAIDEHRKDYQATLWTSEPQKGQDVEQRWFPGAHANVGGGYRDDLLPDKPLAWIVKKAQDRGLAIDSTPFRLDNNEYRSPVRDSFSEFLGGLYKWVTFNSRYYRPIGTTSTEVIDESAFRKWRADTSYRPRNLAHATMDANMVQEG